MDKRIIELASLIDSARRSLDEAGRELQKISDSTHPQIDYEVSVHALYESILPTIEKAVKGKSTYIQFEQSRPVQRRHHMDQECSFVKGPVTLTLQVTYIPSEVKRYEDSLRAGGSDSEQ